MTEKRGLFSNRMDLLWFLIVASSWLMIVGANMLPASLWFTVDSVHVQDTSISEDPKMEVAREVHRPFTGRWIATLYRQNINGAWSAFCTGRGANDYRPGVVLPDDLRLSWWMERQCVLPPGNYVLRTTWRMEVFNWLYKDVSIQSNEFQVTGL